MTCSLLDQGRRWRLAHTTLTISIGTAPPEIANLTPRVRAAMSSVDKDDLSSRGPGQSGGSDPAEIHHPRQGLRHLGAGWRRRPDRFGGQAVITNGLFCVGPVIINTPLGNVLTITAYNSGTGQVDYTYERLTDNETHPNANGQNSVTEGLRGGAHRPRRPVGQRHPHRHRHRRRRLGWHRDDDVFGADGASCRSRSAPSSTPMTPTPTTSRQVPARPCRRIRLFCR